MLVGIVGWGRVGGDLGRLLAASDHQIDLKLQRGKGSLMRACPEALRLGVDVPGETRPEPGGTVTDVLGLRVFNVDPDEPRTMGGDLRVSDGLFISEVPACHSVPGEALPAERSA